jgi:hypothetical protein
MQVYERHLVCAYETSNWKTSWLCAFLEGQLGPTGQANNRQLLTTTCLESGSDHILLYQVYRQVLHPKENETN